MFTFCPACTTVFAVKADHLHAAGGLVRCGSCNHVYSAVDYLFEEMTAARDAAAAHKAPAGQSEAAGPDAAAGELQAPEPEAGSGSSGPAPAAEEEPAAASATGWSASTGWHRRPAAWRVVINGAGIVLLVFLLGTQWLYFNRDELAHDANLRPVLEHLCTFLQCDLPLMTDLAQIELLERDVRGHPGADEALLINATIANRAGHAQPYPVFSVSFSSISGETVAMRYFRPGEYLGDDTAITAGMAPGAQVHAVLEIADPGDAAVSFQLDFL